jgi:hypothetical protein
MTEVTNTNTAPAENAAVVFDCGPGNYLTISGIAFANGLAITDKEADKTLLRNYIEQTGSNWTEEVFDPNNNRHVSAGIPANMEHIVTGIQTASHLKAGEHQLAQAIVDGTYGDLLSTPEGQAAADIASLVTPAAIAKATAAGILKK